MSVKKRISYAILIRYPFLRTQCTSNKAITYLLTYLLTKETINNNFIDSNYIISKLYRIILYVDRNTRERPDFNAEIHCLDT